MPASLLHCFIFAIGFVATAVALADLSANCAHSIQRSTSRIRRPSVLLTADGRLRAPIRPYIATGPNPRRMRLPT